MLALDGSTGGGQLVRTAVALAAVTGTGFRMDGVRGGRSEPGLRAQHLAAVDAAAALCDAAVEGAALGSETLRFRPGRAAGGDASVDVGTAGSVPLVFDAVLPLAAALDEPATVHATGGTDVRWSPTFAYQQRVKLPVAARFGLDADTRLDRTGFYPAGGGSATLRLRPSALEPAVLDARGDPRDALVHSKATRDLADRSVAERQATAAAGALPGDLPAPDRRVEYVDADSTGSVVTVVARYDRTALGGSALGEQGKLAESVGEDAADALADAHRSAAAVDRHAADQLVPVLALAGGRVTIPAVTDHVESVVDLVRRFDRPVRIEDGAPPTLVADR